MLDKYSVTSLILLLLYLHSPTRSDDERSEDFSIYLWRPRRSTFAEGEEELEV